MKAIRRLAGLILVILATLWLVLNLFIAAGLDGIYIQQGTELTDVISRWGIVGPFILGVALLFVGFVSYEGSKRRLLFLRPFNSIANELTMRSVSGRLGGSYTAVALDDGVIPAPRSSARDIAVSLFLMFPAGLLLLLFSAVTLPNAGDVVKNPELASISASIPAVLSGYFGVLAIGKVWRSLFPKSNKVVADSRAKVISVAAHVAGLSRWLPRIFVPRSLIVQSTDEHWQDAVTMCGAACDAAIIDLSRQSDSMDWELRYLDQSMHGKFVIMAKSGSVLPTLAEGCGAPIFYYDGNPIYGRQFSRDIRRYLDRLSA
jgi:hypothetical protein